MFNRKVAGLVAGVVLGGVVLAGCSSPAEVAPNDEGSVSVPSSSSAPVESSAPAESAPGDGGSDDGGLVVVDPGGSDASADVTADLSAFTEGATLSYPVGSVVLVKTDDPTKVTFVSLNNDVIGVESLKSGNAAGYDIGLRVKAAGSAQVGVISADGSSVTVNVVGE